MVECVSFNKFIAPIASVLTDRGFLVFINLNMENYVHCPQCDSTHIRERHIGKKSGAVAGAATVAALDGVVFDRYECMEC